VANTSLVSRFLTPFTIPCIPLPNPGSLYPLTLSLAITRDVTSITFERVDRRCFGVTPNHLYPFTLSASSAWRSWPDEASQNGANLWVLATGIVAVIAGGLCYAKIRFARSKHPCWLLRPAFYLIDRYLTGIGRNRETPANGRDEPDRGMNRQVLRPVHGFRCR
jgi:hypothetical protein